MRVVHYDSLRSPHQPTKTHALEGSRRPVCGVRISRRKVPQFWCFVWKDGSGREQIECLRCQRIVQNWRTS